MDLKLDSKWEINLEDDKVKVLDNYVYGFPKIKWKGHEFETLRVFVTINKITPEVEKTIEVELWSDGETFSELSYVVPDDLKEEVKSLLKMPLLFLE